ncbi:phosphotransferase family protein [Haloarcula litorea]|uniref:phosphotransferase family protein n=1 Tax=Haloarcula litorea TaxID=3032579 RepID=UPI0023E7F74D|nr:aminoglycoside phosphotransferase family protein [Halomicroarcula sp. GDY20]
MTAAEAVLDRVVGAPPDALERPPQGNHKRTVVARYRDRPSLVVQTANDAAALRTEAELLRAVADRTDVPVPELVAAGELDGRGYLVTEHVAGADLHERFVALPTDDRVRLARRFGSILGTLHDAFPFDGAGAVSLDDGSLVAAGRTSAAVAREYAADALAALPPAFDDLRPAVAAAPDPPTGNRRPRLFPWDLRPGNAVVADGRLAAVLDWGGPRAADPALSVAKTEHVVARWYGVDSDRLAPAFREGYRSVRPLPDVTAAHRLAAVAAAAVDSDGVVTRPGYPERTGTDAVTVHRAWLSERLTAAESE